MIHHCVKASWLWELGPNIPRDFKCSTHPEAFFTTATHFFIGVSKKNTCCSCPPCSSPRPALSRQEVCLSSGLGAAAHLGDVPQVRRSRGQIPVRAITSFSTQSPSRLWFLHLSLQLLRLHHTPRSHCYLLQHNWRGLGVYRYYRWQMCLLCVL